jgi:hypothetical protein
MDHDSVDRRLQKVERFLDSQASGWRDESRWGQQRRRVGDASSATIGGDDEGRAPDGTKMDVNEEQTKKDREALGITEEATLRNGHIQRPMQAQRSQNPGVDDGKDAELRENFRAGRGAVSDEQIQQEERADLLGRLETYRGREDFPEMTGHESNDELRAMLAKVEPSPGTGNAANEVALEAARANPATEQALQTSQDPQRAERARQQAQAKRNQDDGADTRMPVAPASR